MTSEEKLLWMYEQVHGETNGSCKAVARIQGEHYEDCEVNEVGDDEDDSFPPRQPDR